MIYTYENGVLVARSGNAISLDDHVETLPERQTVTPQEIDAPRARSSVLRGDGAIANKPSRWYHSKENRQAFDRVTRRIGIVLAVLGALAFTASRCL